MITYEFARAILQTPSSQGKPDLGPFDYSGHSDSADNFDNARLKSTLAFANIRSEKQD